MKPVSPRFRFFDGSAPSVSSQPNNRRGAAPPVSPHAFIAVINASEPKSLITRFMLYASMCKLIGETPLQVDDGGELKVVDVGDRSSPPVTNLDRYFQRS